MLVVMVVMIAVVKLVLVLVLVVVLLVVVMKASSSKSWCENHCNSDTEISGALWALYKEELLPGYNLTCNVNLQYYCNSSNIRKNILFHLPF